MATSQKPRKRHQAPPPQHTAPAGNRRASLLLVAVYLLTAVSVVALLLSLVLGAAHSWMTMPGYIAASLILVYGKMAWKEPLNIAHVQYAQKTMWVVAAVPLTMMFVFYVLPLGDHDVFWFALMTVVLFLLLAAWTLWRCGKGLYRLQKRETVAGKWF